MAGKIQIPAVGGLRKVIKTGAAVNPGTTIAEYGSGTITLAQLRAALGITGTTAKAGSSGSPTAALNVGPGLAGGGLLVGAVPLQLVAPIPFMIGDDSGGGDGEVGPPGVNGLQGITGAAGPAGPAIFFLPDDPEPALDAVPGSVGPPGGTGAVGPVGPAVFFLPDDPESALDAVPGPQGAIGPQGTIGATGAAGPPGPAVFLLSEGEDGEVGPPGPTGPAGSGGATGVNVTPDTHPSTPTAWDDEFEYGTSLDTMGARRSGANAWSWFNQTTSTGPVASGSLCLTLAYIGSSTSVTGVYQAAPSGSWTIQAKIAGIGDNFAGMFVGSPTGKFYIFGMLGSSSAMAVYAMNSYTSASGSVASFTTPASNLNAFATPWWYLSVAWDGTNLVFSASLTGVPGSFVTVYTIAGSSFLGGAPSDIGLCGQTYPSTDPAFVVCDWFRRTF